MKRVSERSRHYLHAIMTEAPMNPAQHAALQRQRTLARCAAEDIGDRRAVEPWPAEQLDVS